MPRISTVTRDSDQVLLRLPEGMRDALKRMAVENDRSMNAQIVALLRPSVETSNRKATA
jgi:hypothetical protein